MVGGWVCVHVSMYVCVCVVFVKKKAKQSQSVPEVCLSRDFCFYETVS